MSIQPVGMVSALFAFWGIDVSVLLFLATILIFVEPGGSVVLRREVSEREARASQ